MFPPEQVPAVRFDLGLQNASSTVSPDVQDLRAILFPNTPNSIKAHLYATARQSDFSRFLPKVEPLHPFIAPKTNKTIQ